MGVDIAILAEDAEPALAGRLTWHLVGPPAFTDWSTVVRPPDVDTAARELQLRAVFEDVEPLGRSAHRVYKWFGFLGDDFFAWMRSWGVDSDVERAAFPAAGRAVLAVNSSVYLPGQRDGSRRRPPGPTISF